ncbi:MAG TPA: preprotein translocase subunit SecE [Acidimicrobiales bacterium]|jgi:preprotein translocase subunit SecE|nr:preprotein translocase subunit SecE [Acidimicrobiales bacterium]
MNREQKRLLQRQGQLGPDGAPVARRREGPARPAPAVAARRERTKPREFLHEVNVEMRKVAWPSRAETANYSLVVLVTLVVVIVMIFLLDYIFAKGAIFLFK